MINTVLIADDSPMARMFVRRCLEVAGLLDVNFIEANDGEEALAKLQNVSVDMIITDLNMPKLDGMETLKRIKANPSLKEIPVIVVTSNDNTAKAEQVRDLGAFAVLGKPIAPPALAEVIAPLMEK